MTLAQLREAFERVTGTPCPRSWNKDQIKFAIIDQQAAERKVTKLFHVGGNNDS
jgi:hypothetical protein